MWLWPWPLAGIGKKAKDPIAAISLGKVNGELMVDLAYVEDSAAEVDLNLVLTKGGELVEVQGSAEKGLFSPAELGRMVESGVQAAGAYLRGPGRGFGRQQGLRPGLCGWFWPAATRANCAR
jgi:hypothetical protein